MFPVLSLFARLAIVVAAVFLSISPAISQEPSPTPRPIREEVIVTTDRIETRIGETPASVVSITSTDIDSTAASTIDEVLRQSVGFSIFRRTASRIANPTTQGVSLRGTGSSGASRSAVFLDGVTLNDPFGGWVQWGRVVPIGVEGIEIRRGGSSSLYGASGLSGAVNIKSREVANRYVFSADAFGGTQGTISGSTFAGYRDGAWSADVTAGSYQSRGYVPIEEDVRGPIDSNAGVRNSSISSRLTYRISDRGRLFVRPSYFGEVRANGTGLQTNRTHFRQAATGGDLRLNDEPREIRINWSAALSSQVYDQIFSAVNPARTAESLTRLQRSPAQMAIASGYVSAVLASHVLIGGAEVRNVRGSSDETGYTANLPTALFGAGGRETIIGLFVQDFVRVGERMVISASARYDCWHHRFGLRVTRPLTSPTSSVTVFPDRSEGALSPHLAVLINIDEKWSIYGSASRSFRSPTLNELYRGFRVGNVQTLANEYLEAERAFNTEAGVRLRRARGSVRANVFWTRIDGPISNITVSSTPTLITRQRRNTGQTLSRGIEIEGEIRLGRLDLSAGYLFVDAVVSRSPDNRTIEGLLVPQVAKHQATLQARYSVEKWTFAMQARASGEQFDDDLNQFRLEPYAQVDLFAARRIGERLNIYAAVENIFNSIYSTGRTPLRTVSSPANFRIGIRWK